MPKFCANLSFLWSELDFPDRFRAAAHAGFSGVEYLFPYDHDKGRIAALLKQHGLTQVLFNLPAGDWAGGERGIGCHPGRAKEFEEGVAKAIDYAAALGCQQINCLAGIRPRHVDANVARETYPGRHEPGTGEIHYPFLFGHLDRLGYGGWIGCEYKPATTTDAGLGWARPYLRR